jgi:hypothetical protein
MRFVLEWADGGRQTVSTLIREVGVLRFLSAALVRYPGRTNKHWLDPPRSLSAVEVDQSVTAQIEFAALDEQRIPHELLNNVLALAFASGPELVR